MRIGVVVIFLLAFSICVIVSCGWKSGLDEITYKPTVQELSGIYKPDRYTRELLGKGFTEGAEIRLEKNKILRFSNAPKSIFDFGAYYSADRFAVSGSGQWGIYLNEHPEISVSLEAENGAFKPFSTSYPLYKQGSKYVIFIMMGDPDEHAAARFVQQ